MTMHALHAGTWRTMTEVHARHAGAWQEITEGYVRHAGVWEQFLASNPVTYQWYPTDTQPYRSTGAQRTDKGATIYQGYYSSTYGEHRSMLMFDYSNIQATLAGKTVSAVTLRLTSQHFYYGDFNNPIGETRHGTHNVAATTAPATYSETHLYSDATYGATHSWPGGFTGARTQTQTITLPNAVGTALRDGTIKGLTLRPNSTSQFYYCYFDGSDAVSSSTKPLLSITAV